MESNEYEPFQGRYTAQFGKWLTGFIETKPEYENYLVYYDHGDSRLPNVVAIKGFYGKSVKNLNRLTDVDILVAKPDGKIVLLIEIEETYQSPQKYIGSVFSILMCNQFAVGSNKNQRYFTTNEVTKLIVAGILPTNRRLKKIHHIIAPRLQQFSAPIESIDPKNVHFLFSSNIAEVINRLKIVTKEILKGDKGNPNWDSCSKEYSNALKETELIQESDIKRDSIMSNEKINPINWNKFPEKIKLRCRSIADEVVKLHWPRKATIEYNGSSSFKAMVEGKTRTVAKLIPQEPDYPDPEIYVGFSPLLPQADNYARRIHWRVEKYIFMNEEFFVARIPDDLEPHQIAEVFAQFLKQSEPQGRHISL